MRPLALRMIPYLFISTRHEGCRLNLAAYPLGVERSLAAGTARIHHVRVSVTNSARVNATGATAGTAIVQHAPGQTTAAAHVQQPAVTARPRHVRNAAAAADRHLRDYVHADVEKFSGAGTVSWR